MLAGMQWVEMKLGTSAKLGLDLLSGLPTLLHPYPPTTTPQAHVPCDLCMPVHPVIP